jgi:hypothetical protein
MSAPPNQLETELNTYRAIQKEIGKVQNQISTAQTQILENEMVLKARSARHTSISPPQRTRRAKPALSPCAPFAGVGAA